MPLRQTRFPNHDARLRAEFDAIRTELGIVVEFTPDVIADADRAIAADNLPGDDASDIEFVTIDPEGSRDLDQALAIARDGDGHIVHYAIADLSVVVAPGGPIDVEAHRRGQTMYAPDQSAPLHPRQLSEGAASLLPDQTRAAYVWRFELDERGAVVSTSLRRARVRSREQLSYVEAQRRIDAGDDVLGLLREVGERRLILEAERAGATLDLPDEEVTEDDGRWVISRRAMLPVEQWNAQISLMTGMAAAELQIGAKAGILRTMPRPFDDTMAEFRQQSEALGVPWLPGEQYGAYLRRLDRTQPTTLAILTAARSLFRGAGYRVIDGTETDDELIQAAIGGPYTHTTAPLRRLVDRFVLAHCEAIANDHEIPAWAREGLDALPAIMAETGRLASRLEREVIAAVTAVVLEPLVGETFEAFIADRNGDRADLTLVDPPVSVDAVIPGAPGTTVRVRLVSVDDAKAHFTAA